MSKHSISISIPKPCHEDWDAMSPEARGRYCAACQKTVTDFSLMSDGQMLDILKKDEAQSSCGRFAAEQLDRALIDTRYKPSFLNRVYTRAAAMLLLCQSVTVAAMAQVKKPAMHTQQANKNKPAAKEWLIKGQLIDNDTHNPVSGLRVQAMVSGIAKDTIANNDGSFTLLLTELPKDSITLYIEPNSDTTFLGPQKISPAEISEGKEIVIYAYKRERRAEAVIKEYRKPLVQGYKVTYIRTNEEIPRTTWWQRITKPFRRIKRTE